MRPFDGLHADVPLHVLLQLCEALDVPYESPDGHGMRAYTYPEILELVRGRSDAWRTLLTRIEQVDPEWLDRWRKGLEPPPDRLP